MKTEAVVHKKGKPLSVEEIYIPHPKKDEVVVEMAFSGICGSQLLNFDKDHKFNGGELLGHEGTGTVVDKGVNVNNVGIGERVLISWLPYNTNENTQYKKYTTVYYNDLPIKHVLFTWSKHTLLHKQFVTRLPDDIGMLGASVLGCAGISGYGCVVNNIEYDMHNNHTVVIYGMGGLGLLGVNGAKKQNIKNIITVDMNDKKLEFSKYFGATRTINPKHQNIENINADIAFDMVGTEETVTNCINMVRPGVCGYRKGGTVVVSGFSKEPVSINFNQVILGQKTIKGSRGGGCVGMIDFPTFYNDIRNGNLMVNKLITNSYNINKVNDAIDDLKNNRILGRGVVKLC